MASAPQPSAADLARYIEQRGGWMLQMLRLAKPRKASMSPESYIESLQEAHTDLMRLGEFWKGREAEFFQVITAHLT